MASVDEWDIGTIFSFFRQRMRRVRDSLHGQAKKKRPSEIEARSVQKFKKKKGSCFGDKDSKLLSSDSDRYQGDLHDRKRATNETMKESKKRPSSKVATHFKKGTGEERFRSTSLTLGIDDDEFFDVKGELSHTRRKMIDGYTIYTQDELHSHLSKQKKETSGLTSLCPFDCDCCF